MHLLSPRHGVRFERGAPHSALNYQPLAESRRSMEQQWWLRPCRSKLELGFARDILALPLRRQVNAARPYGREIRKGRRFSEDCWYQGCQTGRLQRSVAACGDRHRLDALPLSLS